METKTLYITYMIDGEEVYVPIVCHKEIYEHIDNTLTNHIDSPAKKVIDGLISYHAALLGLDPENNHGRIYFPGEADTVYQDTLSITELPQ